MTYAEGTNPSTPLSEAFEFATKARDVLAGIAGNSVDYDTEGVVAMLYGGYPGIDPGELTEDEAGLGEPRRLPPPSTEALARLNWLRRLLRDHLNQEFGNNVVVEPLATPPEEQGD